MMRKSTADSRTPRVGWHPRPSIPPSTATHLKTGRHLLFRPTKKIDCYPAAKPSPSSSETRLAGIDRVYESIQRAAQRWDSSLFVDSVKLAKVRSEFDRVLRSRKPGVHVILVDVRGAWDPATLDYRVRIRWRARRSQQNYPSGVPLWSARSVATPQSSVAGEKRCRMSRSVAWSMCSGFHSDLAHRTRVAGLCQLGKRGTICRSSMALHCGYGRKKQAVGIDG